MDKFNIGDVIEITNKSAFCFYFGDIGTILQVSQDNYLVNFNNNRNIRVIDDGIWWVPGEYIKLIPSKVIGTIIDLG